jgi:hypothetical protein
MILFFRNQFYVPRFQVVIFYIFLNFQTLLEGT